MSGQNPPAINPEVTAHFRKVVRYLTLRAYDNVEAMLIERMDARQLYQTQFKDLFPSFGAFWKFTKAIEIDPLKPSNEQIVEKLSDVADGEDLLGLKSGYTEADVKQRYLVLMKQVHPDVVGPNGIASRLNTARDLIMARNGWK